MSTGLVYNQIRLILDNEMANRNDLKTFKKIPIYIVEEHNDVLQFIYDAIGGKKLPVNGTTLVHLDAHPDMLISRRLSGNQARSGRFLLPLLEIENWIVPATAAGFLGRVIWLRSPWAHQLEDGTRTIRVGDQPETGLLRLDSKEPYFLSDALYCSELVKERAFSLTVAELGDPDHTRGDEADHVRKLADTLKIDGPYVLDIDLDFFSTGNPFRSMYENIGLYDRLEEIFEFKLPISYSDEIIKDTVNARNKQLDELATLFEHLEEHGSLDSWTGDVTETFTKVKNLADLLTQEANKTGVPVEWWSVYAAGCTRDQGGLPDHRSTEEQINNMITRSLRSLLKYLPPPVLITIARSTDDGYCPRDQVEEIQSLVLQELKNAYKTDDPVFYYRTNAK